MRLLSVILSTSLLVLPLGAAINTSSKKVEISAHASPAEAQVVHGSTSFDNAHLNGLTVYGETDIKKTAVKGGVEIFGHFSALESNVGTLKVFGAARLTKVTVNGATQIHGSLDAKHAVLSDTQVFGAVKAEHSSFAKMQVFGTLHADHSFFNGPLSINSVLAKMNDCQAKALTFAKQTHDPRIQKLILDGKTSIDGPIEFESGTGLIIVKSKKVLLPKIIKGARVENHFGLLPKSS